MIQELNLLGLDCPTPQIYTKQALKQLPNMHYLQVLVSYVECYNAILEIAIDMGCMIHQVEINPHYYKIIIYKP